MYEMTSISWSHWRALFMEPMYHSPIDSLHVVTLIPISAHKEAALPNSGSVKKYRFIILERLFENFFANVRR